MPNAAFFCGSGCSADRLLSTLQSAESPIQFRLLNFFKNLKGVVATPTQVGVENVSET